MDTGNSGSAGPLVMLDAGKEREREEDFVMSQDMEARNVRVMTENQKYATWVNVVVRDYDDILNLINIYTTDIVTYKLRVLDNEMNHPKLKIPITEDLTFILNMEQAVGYSSRTPNGLHWKSPMLRFSFYEDVLNKAHILLHYQPYRNKRSISRQGLETYNQIVGQSIDKMNKFANDCDQATKKFGISQVVSGGAAIVSGLMVGLGRMTLKQLLG